MNEKKEANSLSIFGYTFLVLLISGILEYITIDQWLGWVLYSLVLVALFFVEVELYMAKLNAIAYRGLMEDVKEEIK